MKKFILGLVLIAVVAIAGQLNFTTDEVNTLLGKVNTGLTTNVVIYGTDGAGDGIYTNSLTYTNGLLVVFP